MGSVINLNAAVLECISNNGIQDIPELTLKVSEQEFPPLVDVEYMGLNFNFAILYDMGSFDPYGRIGITGKNFNISFSGKNTVSADVNVDEVKNVHIDCSFIGKTLN